jgi:hypothetical protein
MHCWGSHRDHGTRVKEAAEGQTLVKLTQLGLEGSGKCHLLGNAVGDSAALGALAGQ